MNQLPLSRNVDARKLEQLFEQSESCTNGYFLLAMLNIINEDGQLNVSTRDLFAEVMAESWHALRFTDLQFQKKDCIVEISELIKPLILKYEKSGNLRKVDIVEFLQDEESPIIDKAINLFRSETFLDILRPWIPNQTFSRQVEKLSQSYENGCLYAIKDGELRLNHKWVSYLKSNIDEVKQYVLDAIKRYFPSTKEIIEDYNISSSAFDYYNALRNGEVEYVPITQAKVGTLLSLDVMRKVEGAYNDFFIVKYNEWLLKIDVSKNYGKDTPKTVLCRIESMGSDRKPHLELYHFAEKDNIFERTEFRNVINEEEAVVNGPEEDSEEYEAEVVEDDVEVEERTMTEEELALFQKLHDSRVHDWETFRKKAYKGIWAGIIEKYPDSAHFIYELLQNADDVQATKVHIVLFKDFLIFKHNGKIHFDITDPDDESKLGHINSITGIGDSTKSSEELSENKIGKFGVGFKAVFQYTDAPQVYDDVFRFRIDNYIVPTLLDDDHELRKPGETLFCIPFKNAPQNFKDILTKLSRLDNPILFLNHIKTVSWEDASTIYKPITYVYNKTITEEFKRGNISCQRVTVVNNNKRNELWLFNRSVYLGSNGSHNIAVGYYLTEDGESIMTTVKPNAHCFFPTKESFGSCFISHAPFQLVDSRQNIKNNTELNSNLVNHIVHLAADALVLLRDIGIHLGKRYINENLFDIVKPKYKYDLGYGHPKDTNLINNDAFNEVAIEVIERNALLLSRGNEYLFPSQAFIPAPLSLYDLLNTTQVNQLYEDNDDAVDFINRKILDKNSKDILIQLKVNQFTGSDLANKLTESFQKKQPEEWIFKLYTFLRNEVKGLWSFNAARKNTEQELPFRKAPIILTTEERWVAPYAGDRINVFYPSSAAEGEYNFVHARILSNKIAHEFLNELGVKEPDKKDYIYNVILPYYSGTTIPVTREENVEHLRILYDYYYNAATLEERDLLIAKIKKSNILVVNSTDGKSYYTTPDNTYYTNSFLAKFYEGEKDIYFLQNDQYKSLLHGKDGFREFLHVLGVTGNPRIISTTKYEEKGTYGIHDIQWLSQKRQDYIKSIADKNFNRRTASRINDHTVKYLANALNRIRRDKDQNMTSSIFKWLVNRIEVIDKFKLAKIEYRYREWYYLQCDSDFIDVLKNTPWIVVNSGNVKSPLQITQEELAKTPYVQDVRDISSVYSILGITRAEKTLADYNIQDAQLLQNEELAKALRANGITNLKQLGKMLQLAAKQQQQEQKAEEKAKKREEERKAKDEAESFDRKELEKVTANEMFGDSNNLQPENTPLQKPKTEASAERQQKIQDLIESQKEEAEKQSKQAELRDIVDEAERYSKEWFDTLLQLEYGASSEEQSSRSNNGVCISFSSVMQERGSKRILILKNPSRSIPMDVEDIGGIDIHFSFAHKEEISMTFEVANVRDYTLHVKARGNDAEKMTQIDWSQCVKAEINISKPIDLIGRLRNAFNALDLPAGFNLKQNIRQDIKFVFGPPGTGKTTNLAKKICSLMDKNPECKILVLTPTNKACDVLTRRIDEIFIDNADDNEKMSPIWLHRFVATGDEYLEDNGFVVERHSECMFDDQSCVISTIARLSFDGFNEGKLSDWNWDYVFIDEASMIPLAQTIYAIYKFEQSQIFIAGDPLQIPPIVREAQWKDENIYTMIHLDRFQNPQTEPCQFEIENLTTQYRSIPAIGEVFSKYSYNGLLKHHRTNDEQFELKIKDFPMKAINFVPFKVDRFHSIFSAKKLDGSNVHVYSVLLMTEITRYIVSQYAKDKKARVLRIGIICPYAPQAQMIERLIEQYTDLPSNVEINVGTIHGFQGDECEIVFCVFNPPTGLKGAADRIFLNKQHIINVGISRAKDYLFLLLPHKDTDGFANLREIINVGKIASADHSHLNMMTCDEVERIIFGKPFYIENNTFLTSHQMANVYSQASMRYEVRIDDNSVDIQIGNE